MGEVFPSSAKALTGLATLALVCSSASDSHANIGDSFGFGSRAGALAGAMVADDREGYSAYSNPAAVSHLRADGFTLGFGFVLMEPGFTPIDGVIVENDEISDVNSPAADVDVDYRATFGQVLGLNFRLAPDLWNLGLGIVGYLPGTNFAYVDSGETYVPEYPMYRARTQRSQFHLALGAQPSEVVRIGAGMHVGFAFTGQASIFLTPDSAKSSAMRFSATLKPKASPYFGLIIAIAEGLDFGLVARLPLNSEGTLRVRAAAEIIGSFDLNYLGRSALVYDPQTLEFGLSWQHSPIARLSLQADFQRWERYRPPAFQIEDPQSESGLPIQGSGLASVELRNIVIPRVAEEVRIGPSTIRAGYAYRPGIFVPGSLSATSQGNLLDPSKHVFTVGYGHQFSSLFGLQKSWNLDLHAAYHRLIPQTIAKSGDVVGAPGYKAGGKILGGGVSLSLAL